MAARASPGFERASSSDKSVVILCNHLRQNLSDREEKFAIVVISVEARQRLLRLRSPWGGNWRSDLHPWKPKILRSNDGAKERGNHSAASIRTGQCGPICSRRSCAVSSRRPLWHWCRGRSG